MAGSAPHIPGCRDLSLIGERVARSLFSAWSDAAGRPVTVTVFPPLSEGRTRADFDRAAATGQRLGAHPSVLTIHEWGHATDGRPWIVTDPRPPESVDTLLTMDGPLEVERALQVGVLLAGALETAHRAGIVHGDMQPDRLVFGAHGEPLLVETGLASFAVFPGLGALNNPVRYHAPPEVLERTDVTPATDVYSLATTVYALLAARAPQQKPAEVTDSNASLLLRILQMSVPPIDRRDLPPGLEDTLRGPLSANPSKRPQQAIEVAWLLQDVQRRAGMPVTEPVVLDLDGTGSEQGAPIDLRHAAAVDLRDVAHPAGDAAPAPARLAAGDRGPDLAPPLAGLAASAAPDLVPDDEVMPPPTIFPFAEGHDGAPTTEVSADPWAASGNGGAESPWAAPAAPPPDSPWSALAGRDAAQGLWSAPPDDAAQDAPWAAPLADPDDRPASHFAAPTGADTASPWAPGDADAASAAPWAPADADAASAAPWAPADDSAPSPWTTPVDEGPGAPWAPTDDTAGRSPWAASAEEDPAPTLWPSTWPAEPDGDEPPPWAAAPPAAADDETRPRHAPAHGHDGGSIADSGAFAAAPGPGDGSPPAGAALPAELDELPSWYTDPLPNTADGPTNGHGHDARPPSNGHADPPVSWAGPADLPDGGPGGRTAGAPAPWDAPWAAAAAEPATGPAAEPAAGPVDSRRLPGAGDELRSLFGEVVGDPGVPAPPEARSPRSFDDDPLGPPETRPPLDLGQLDSPLGPTPFLPSSGTRPDDAPPADQGRPSRLPRRHEPQTWTSPGGEGASAPPARLPRADEVDPARRPARPGPRQVAPAAGQRPGPSLRPSASAGPPALPVVILVAVVIVLALGVAWLVLTGDDEGAPATDRRDPPTSEPAVDEPDGSSTGADRAAADATGAGPAAVQVDELPEGIQVSWSGASDASYVVTVLSADAPPAALPATIGTSALVPNVEGSSEGGRCFTVSAAGSEGQAGPASEPVCTPGASADQMAAG